MAVDVQHRTETTGLSPSTALKKHPREDVGSTLRRRGASIRMADQPSPLESSPSKDVVESTTGDSPPSIAATVASLLETVELQVGVIAVIMVDIVVAVVGLYIESHLEILRLQSVVTRVTAKGSKSKSTRGLDVDDIDTTAPPPVVVNVMLRVLDAISGFTIVLFLLELVVLAVTYRRRFLAHFGYVVDLVVVATSVVVEVYTASKAVRLLGLLRVWRVVRLATSLLDKERDAHEQTLDALDYEKSLVDQLQIEKRAAENSLKKEYESRAGLERMLQGYKDEADTLREALNIAAEAVAVASMQPATEGEEYATEQYDYQVSYDVSSYDPAIEAVETSGDEAAFAHEEQFDTRPAEHVPDHAVADTEDEFDDALEDHSRDI